MKIKMKKIKRKTKKKIKKRKRKDCWLEILLLIKEKVSVLVISLKEQNKK